MPEELFWLFFLFVKDFCMVCLGEKTMACLFVVLCLALKKILNMPIFICFLLVILRSLEADMFSKKLDLKWT